MIKMVDRTKRAPYSTLKSRRRCCLVLPAFTAGTSTFVYVEKPNGSPTFQKMFENVKTKSRYSSQGVGIIVKTKSHYSSQGVGIIEAFLPM